MPVRTIWYGQSPAQSKTLLEVELLLLVMPYEPRLYTNQRLSFQAPVDQDGGEGPLRKTAVSSSKVDTSGVMAPHAGHSEDVEIAVSPT